MTPASIMASILNQVSEQRNNKIPDSSIVISITKEESEILSKGTLPKLDSWPFEGQGIRIHVAGM